MTNCTECGHELGTGRYCTNCGPSAPAVGPSPLDEDLRTGTAERRRTPTPPPAPPPAWTPPPAPRFPLYADEVDRAAPSRDADSAEQVHGVPEASTHRRGAP